MALTIHNGTMALAISGTSAAITALTVPELLETGYGNNHPASWTAEPLQDSAERSKSFLPLRGTRASKHVRGPCTGHPPLPGVGGAAC
jgi:hypothetical protein